MNWDLQFGSVSGRRHQQSFDVHLYLRRNLTTKHQSLWRTAAALRFGDPVNRCRACRSLPEQANAIYRAR